MVYKYGERVKRGKRSIKKYVVGAIASIVMVGGAAIPAFAANDYCGASANGCEHSQANTQCAGHGAFGAFGKDNSFAGGASGDRTAYANSTLCGNPSDNSSAATLGDVPTK
jgi:hypothetical protein